MHAKTARTAGLLVAIAIAIPAPMVDLDGWAIAILVGCLGIALALRLHWAMHSALLTTFSALFAEIPVLAQTIRQLPILPLLIPLLMSSALIAARPATRNTLQWVQWGRVNTTMWILVGVTGIGSAVGLILWAVWTDSLGIGAQMMESVANLPRPALVFGLIPIFAVFNAITEEAVFRGVLFTALAQSSKSMWFANVAQAAAFAAIHYEAGFPNGLAGYALALIYGVVLGFLRARTNGLLAPVTAHIVADLVIGYILLFGTRMT